MPFAARPDPPPAAVRVSQGFGGRRELKAEGQLVPTGLFRLLGDGERGAVITLAGRVATYAQRRAAETAAKLEGAVEWEFERQAAYDAVCVLTGVKGVNKDSWPPSERARGVGGGPRGDPPRPPSLFEARRTNPSPAGRSWRR